MPDLLTGLVGFAVRILSRCGWYCTSNTEDAYRAAHSRGPLMYGAGHVWAGRAHFYLHDQELSRSPPDESIDMLNCCLSGPHFPPPAIVEVLQTMSPTITRYGGCISLWWTCGGHGSTILPRPGQSLTSFGSFGIVMTPVG